MKYVSIAILALVCSAANAQQPTYAQIDAAMNEMRAELPKKVGDRTLLQIGRDGDTLWSVVRLDRSVRDKIESARPTIGPEGINMALKLANKEYQCSDVRRLGYGSRIIYVDDADRKWAETYLRPADCQ